MSNQIKAQIDSQNKEEVEAQITDCPKCKTGKIVDKGTFYGCTNYKADEPCKFSLPKKWSDKALSKTVIKQLVNNGETSLIKGFKSKKTGKKFDAKLTIKEGKLSFDFG